MSGCAVQLPVLAIWEKNNLKNVKALNRRDCREGKAKEVEEMEGRDEKA